MVRAAHGAHEKGLELVCRVRPDVPDGVVGDAGRLRQVVTNLVGNAIEFTERGEIVVDVGLAAGPAATPEDGANRVIVAGRAAATGHGSVMTARADAVTEGPP